MLLMKPFAANPCPASPRPYSRRDDGAEANRGVRNINLNGANFGFCSSAQLEFSVC